MDKIVVSDLRFSTKIGVYAWEREVAQPVLINLEIGLPSAKPCASDDLRDALDYATVVQRVQGLLSDHPHQLLERLAEAIVQLVLAEFGAPWVKVNLAKIAPLPGVKAIGVSLERGRQTGQAA
jgi:dihydroneopterin aldolase